VARCPVERLMASSVLPARSAASSRAPPSPTPQASRPADLVERQVTAQRPNALWVADLTYIRTWSGLVYAALVIDAFSRAIVGWQLAGPCAPTWPWTPWRWPSGSETPSSTDSSTPPLPWVATRQA
jgi:transposase InsO family protein